MRDSSLFGRSRSKTPLNVRLSQPPQEPYASSMTFFMSSSEGTARKAIFRKEACGMKRVKLLICSLGVCALAIVLGTGGSVLLPAGAEAAGCTCPLAWNTLGQWGMGSSCAAAIANFQSNAEAQAYTNCGMLGRDVCALGTSTHGECRFENGMWKVDGYLQYKCLRCPGEPV